MNDDLKETLQTLGEWKKELDVAVPEIAKTAKKNMMSPEMQTMIEISNRARVVLPEAIKRFAELTAPYAELARNFSNNLTPILVDIARISLPLSVIARLGEIQYVAWKNFPEEFYKQVGATNSKRVLLEVLVSWLEYNDYVEVENAYGDLVIWTQIIEYAKEKDCGIIYVTHDQKEDWWNIVKGRTIGPRIELRREFFDKVGQKFHMYSMDGFIDIFNIMNDVQIDKSAVDEIISLDRTLNRQWDLTLNDRIFKKEETLKKIQRRIDRRKKVLDNIDKNFREEGRELSGNIKVQYENTAQRVKELEGAYNKTQLELQKLRKLSNVR